MVLPGKIRREGCLYFPDLNYCDAVVWNISPNFQRETKSPSFLFTVYKTLFNQFSLFIDECDTNTCVISGFDVV